MKAFVTLAAAMVLAARTAAAQSLVVDTPINATICETVMLAWDGGIPPYSLSIASVLDGAVGILDFGEQTTSANVPWVVNISDFNDPLVVTVIDSTRSYGTSQPFTVQDGPDHACMTASPSSSAVGSSPTSGSTTTTKSGKLSEATIWGIGIGILGLLLLLAAWRVYVLRTRRWAGDFDDKENLVDRKVQKFQLSELQKH